MCTIHPLEVVFRGVLERQLRNLSLHYEKGYKFKNTTLKFFSVEVNRTFFKVHAKNLVKVTKVGEVMSRKKLHTFRIIAFKFYHQNSVIEVCCLSYANS